MQQHMAHRCLHPLQQHPLQQPVVGIRCCRGSSSSSRQRPAWQQQPRPRQTAGRRSLRVAAAQDDPPPSREDRTNPNKADFSAYWSLKFREFFSKRRQYLDSARKAQEPPVVFKRLDAQIALQEEKLEVARMQARRRTVERMEKSPELQQKAAEQDKQLLGDVERARAELHSPRLKLVALTVVQLRAAVKAALLAPFTLPAAAAARWHALFASASYEQFLMSEGERVWAWRNRTENERWFWEVFAMERMIVPILWTVCYQAIVPNNLIWSVLVPFCFISWQNGRVLGPGEMEWWLTLGIGLWKCWAQVCWLAALVFQWW